MKRLPRKTIDQIGIVLLICGVVIGMGVSAVRDLNTWVQAGGLALGLVFVVAGLWLARAFRRADPNRPQNPNPPE